MTSSIDIISIVTDLMGFIATIIIFVLTSIDSRKATEEQTRRESIRATLTDFATIRRAHQGFEKDLTSENRVDKLRNYLNDLERFATGCNLKAYSIEVVYTMSGGTVINQYKKYFRDFITERRRLMKSNSVVRPWTMYTEYEEMVRQIYELRKDKWEEPILRTEEMVILDKFINMRVSNTEDVFEAFRSLDRVIEDHGKGKERYLYIPGKRDDRCLLIAHADTYFDEFYQENVVESDIEYKEGNYVSNSDVVGIGADDRAGCAILWLLRDSGHSLLILDGEEHGQIGAKYLRDSNRDLFNEINEHSFLLQLDRRGRKEYKYYHLPVGEDFIRYIEDATKFTFTQGKGKTDICTLCEKACGVNLSIGYYDEHTPDERLNYNEWLDTYNVVKGMIEKPLKKYKLKSE